MDPFHFEILGQKQAEIFPKLAFIKGEGFYLAGGTGLALQIGHRTSVDFDFYSQKHFDPARFYTRIEAIFRGRTTKTLQEKDTLFCLVRDVELSFFFYEYPLLKKTILIRGVPVASLEDIAAMKLIAISHRPAQRDYIDIFFLLQRFSLAEMFGYVGKKYKTFNRYFAMRALTYFEDIKREREEARAITVLDKHFSWEKAKRKIIEEVRAYQLRMLKK